MQHKNLFYVEDTGCIIIVYHVFMLLIKVIENWPQKAEILYHVFPY